MGVNKYCVSIIILMYNSDLNKTINTIKSVIWQDEIKFEIIMCDDGSKVSHKKEVIDYLEENNFYDYKYLENAVNQGTVRNYLSGLKVAEGEYIYATSPGDMLFDKYVLRDFYQYSLITESKMVFGNSIFYQIDNNRIRLFEGELSNPKRPLLFNQRKNPQYYVAAVLFGERILGATFFREKESSLEYFREIEGIVKYAEDNTIAVLHLIKGENISYFDRNMVWYEYGSGVSTNKNNRWHQLLLDDYLAFYKYISGKYPGSAAIESIQMHYKLKNKYLSLLFRLLVHPTVLMDLMQIKLVKKKYQTLNDNDIEYLKLLVQKGESLI